MFYGLVALQIIAMITLVLSMVYIFRGGASYAQRLMLAFTISELIHNAGFLLEMFSKTQQEAMQAVKVEYLGASAVAVLFMMFILNYCGKKEQRILQRIILVCSLIVVILVWTSSWHPLFYTDISYVQGGVYPHLVLTYGPGFYFYIITCTIVPWTVAMWTLVRTIINAGNTKRTQKYKTIIGGASCAVLVLVLYVFKVFPQGYDPNPAAMALLFSFLVLVVWNRKDFDLSRMATDTVLNSLADCMITLNENHEIQMYNAAAKKLFPDMEIYSNISDVERFPAQILDGEKQFELEEKHYEARLRTVEDYEQTVRGYTILITDVTKTYEHIRELDEIRAQAEAANKAKSDFLANMSHEIRTPMNAVIGMSDVIIEESRGRKIYGYACDIKTAALNLMSIINDILDLSKVEAGKMELVEEGYYLSDLIAETTNLVKMPAEQKGLEFQTDLADDLPCKLYGDEGRIRQVLINLINNSVKFTKEGYVRLEITGRCQDDDNLELQFVVKDSGIGIKEEDLSAIWEAFHQLDMNKNRKIEGTGLGLAITKQLVDLMKGEIRVESEYGKGTCFTICIKQRIADHQTVREYSSTTVYEEPDVDRMYRAESYRILLVDDNNINRKVAIAMLRSYGFWIAEADCGKAAIERMKHVKYDMILMDHMMPEMDGVEATQIIRNECGENGKNAVIIALTANAIRGAREMYLENGFDDFLSKPFERTQLHSLLDKWVPMDVRTYEEG